MFATCQGLDDDRLHDDGIRLEHTIYSVLSETGFIPQVRQWVSRRVGVSLRQQKSDACSGIAV